MLIPIIPFVGFLYAYAHKLDPALYWGLFKRQSFRPVGWTSLPFVFSSPAFDIYEFFDGWYVLSLLSAVVLAFAGKLKDKKITWPIFFWFAVVIFTAGQQDLLPWYRYPLYPFLVISLSVFIHRVLKKPQFMTAMLFPAMLLSARRYLSNAFRPDVLPTAFRLSYIGLTTPFVLLESKLLNKKLLINIARVVLIIVLIMGMWFNVRLIYNMYRVTCESLTCPLGPDNFISRLHYPIIWRLFSIPQ